MNHLGNDIDFTLDPSFEFKHLEKLSLTMNIGLH